MYVPGRNTFFPQIFWLLLSKKALNQQAVQGFLNIKKQGMR